jgi:regulator of sigma E protease
MDLIAGLWNNLIPFIVVLLVVVFVHELGHYIIARMNGVAVEIFSIGIGKELFGWTAKSGTRWRVAWLPLGGYIRMIGDEDIASSGPNKEAKKELPKDSLFAKSPWQRIAVSIGGPLGNFIFAILVFWILFGVKGIPTKEPFVDQIQPGSAAEVAGLKEGDHIQKINGNAISTFIELVKYISENPEQELTLTIRSNGDTTTHDIVVTPSSTEYTDNEGNTKKKGLLGISSFHDSWKEIGFGAAFMGSLNKTWEIFSGTFQSLWGMIKGNKGSGNLQGPIGIAQFTGQAFQQGMAALISFAALISISLGIINLVPIPPLDGGHIFFYLIEAVRGKPVGEKLQNAIFLTGIIFVLGLMVWATWNDILRLFG